MAYHSMADRAVSVRQIQATLRNRAYYLTHTAPIPVNGDYDYTTIEAVRDFQKDFGLPPSGIVDYKTWLMLEGERSVLLDFLYPSVVGELFPPVSEYVSGEGAEDAYIRIMQIMLRELGVHHGAADGVAVTGVYDAQTRAAVTEFQKKNGLTPDGRLTVETRRRIAEDYETGLRDTK